MRERISREVLAAYEEEISKAADEVWKRGIQIMKKIVMKAAVKLNLFRYKTGRIIADNSGQSALDTAIFCEPFSNTHRIQAMFNFLLSS